MRIYVVGAGRAGTALARLCAEAGHDVLGLCCRSAASAPMAALAEVPVHVGANIPPSVDWVWLTVPDRALEDTARSLWTSGALSDRVVLAHASGAEPAHILRQGAPGVRAVVSLHPLQSLARDARTGPLRAATFTAEGESAGVAAARELLAPLGKELMVITACAKPLYHAAAVLASNALVALADAAVEALVSAGVDRDRALEALLPLMEGTLGNLRATGLPGALTGPASRGDAATVAAHVAALGAAPGVLPLYRALSERIVQVAAQGGTPPEALAAVSAALDAP
ncbi:MAG: hypothetical protein AMXMBFR64_60660 [Myxococcales bacterium]